MVTFQEARSRKMEMCSEASKRKRMSSSFLAQTLLLILIASFWQFFIEDKERDHRIAPDIFTVNL